MACTVWREFRKLIPGQDGLDHEVVQRHVSIAGVEDVDTGIRPTSLGRALGERGDRTFEVDSRRYKDFCRHIKLKMKIFIRAVIFRIDGTRIRNRRRRRGEDGVGEAHPVLSLPTSEKETSGEGG